MKEFKVGDKVKCIVYGEGVVYHIQNYSQALMYCIHVEFNKRNAEYTLEGKVLCDGYQTLFHLEDFPEITYKPKKVKIIKYKVLVRNRYDDSLEVSSLYYRDVDEAKQILINKEVLQILESTAKDFWKKE